MRKALFEQLYHEALLTNSSLEKVKASATKQLFSQHWEIKTLLYLGVLLLSSGLGILIYKNIDSIGHQAIIAFIALVTVGCFYYCIKTKAPFSIAKIESPNVYFDYVLLLGCLSFLSLIAYLQFEYTVFGTKYGLASFIPMVVLFFAAYFFDHLGVLSLAITNLAAWIGITVTPTQLLRANDFNSTIIIYSALLLGIVLIALSFASKWKSIKPHFEFTYANFGIHVFFIACLAALFSFEAIYLIWFLVLAIAAWFFYNKSFQQKSFYFLVVVTLYNYIGLSYVVIRLIDSIGHFDMGAIYLGLLYFIGSGIGLVFFLIRSNRKMKAL